MTMISRLGFKPQRNTTIASAHLQSASEITIVIPVKDNQRGINRFLREFFKVTPRYYYPKEIIIVDNNSRPSIALAYNNYPIPVTLKRCVKRGPASARNDGVANSTTDWVLFTDSDCIPTNSLLEGYFKVQNGSIGYAGNIKAYGRDLISQYYEQQEILLPPKVYEETNIRPDYLITANCLVWRNAFNEVGGFNETITIAGGEDIDLGFRLLNIGQLSYAFESIAQHHFGDNLREFIKRFFRYGQGNRIISELHKLDLKPKLFKPNHKSLFNYFLAFVQYRSLRAGYEEKVEL